MGSARVSSNLIPVEIHFGSLKFKTTLHLFLWTDIPPPFNLLHETNDGIVQKWKYIIYVI